jgi:CubicO group peptidase (beta-lactamase class C family)
MWIDPTHEVVVVLLTNRLQFTRANQHILRVRRLLANAVFAEIAKA